MLDYDELHIVDASGRTLDGTLRAEAGQISISFDDSSAEYPITIDLIASKQWHPSFTPQEQAYFGLHITSIGDVNRDGCDDFAIGAHGYHGAYPFVGKVFVFHGMESSLGAWWEGPDSIPSWEKLGAREAGGFGGSLSGGDFNGDGYGDLWLRR